MSNRHSEFEYKVIKMAGGASEDRLNKLAADGWRVISVFPLLSRGEAYYDNTQAVLERSLDE